VKQKKLFCINRLVLILAITNIRGTNERKKERTHSNVVVGAVEERVTLAQSVVHVPAMDQAKLAAAENDARSGTKNFEYPLQFLRTTF